MQPKGDAFHIQYVVSVFHTTNASKEHKKVVLRESLFSKTIKIGIKAKNIKKGNPLGGQERKKINPEIMDNNKLRNIFVLLHNKYRKS